MWEAAGGVLLSGREGLRHRKKPPSPKAFKIAWVPSPAPRGIKPKKESKGRGECFVQTIKLSQKCRLERNCTASILCKRIDDKST